MDRLSETRLAEVHPELARRIHKMAAHLIVESIEIRVTQGYRPRAMQQALWNQGRNEQGDIVDKKAVVTMAPPGHSWHEFGLACDVLVDDPTKAGLQPDWNESHPVWQRVVEVGESCGLVSGSKWRSFPDYPHFQLTGLLPTSPDDKVREAFVAGGLQKVWELSGIDPPQSNEVQGVQV